MNLATLATLALTVLLLSGLCHAAERPNIIVIMTDDQGYGEMSCHGNPILKTPNIDRLQAQSVRFTDFQVSPTCSPTRAALLTGRHEFRNGVSHTIFERERLSLKTITLPQVLKTNGYTTGIFGKWHLGDEDDYLPNRRGFDEVFIHGGGGIGQTYPGSCGDAPGNTYHDPAIWHNDRFVKTKGYCTDVFLNQAISWIDAKRKDKAPFFAWITPNAPHDPFISPGAEWEKPFLDQNLSTNVVRYYAMIAHFDVALGRLLDRLTEWNLDRTTLVIFMTDNGHSAGTFNAGMRGRKGTAYQGGTRVPSFWRWTGKLPAGVDVNKLTAHLDLFPTIVDLIGVGAHPQPEGRSLVPLLKDLNAPWPDRYLFTHFGRWEVGDAEAHKYRVCSVRNARFRFVNNAELYDIQADPGETKNIINDHPKVVAEMRAAYDKWWSEVIPQTVENEQARGPEINPFHARYHAQFGTKPTEAEFKRTNPDLKFTRNRPPL